MFETHHPRRHINSFKYALEGLFYVLHTEANFRLHIFVALIVCAAAAFFNFSNTEWMLLILTISFVLALEMINTVFEIVVDHLWQEEHPRAKIIKDVGAGTVLIGALAACLIGIILFLPHIIG